MPPETYKRAREKFLTTTTLFSKIMPNFWQLVTTPILKFNNSWFLAKNLSNFVSLPWKLHNWYCHNLCSKRQEACLLKLMKERERSSWPPQRHKKFSGRDLMDLWTFIPLYSSYFVSTPVVNKKVCMKNGGEAIPPTESWIGCGD